MAVYRAARARSHAAPQDASPWQPRTAPTTVSPIAPTPTTFRGDTRRGCQAAASCGAAVRRARPPTSPARACRSVAAPPSQGSDAVAPPSAARVACDAGGRLSRCAGSLTRRTTGPVTWQPRTAPTIVSPIAPARDNLSGGATGTRLSGCRILPRGGSTSPAPDISGACLPVRARLPRRKGLTSLLSAARVACDAGRLSRCAGSLTRRATGRVTLAAADRTDHRQSDRTDARQPSGVPPDAAARLPHPAARRFDEPGPRHLRRVPAGPSRLPRSQGSDAVAPGSRGPHFRARGSVAVTRVS